MKFLVRTQDVDGSTRRSYRTRKGASGRFFEMSGRTPEQALLESLPDGSRVDAEQIRYVRTVSDYGTVVIFEVKED